MERAKRTIFHHFKAGKSRWPHSWRDQERPRTIHTKSTKAILGLGIVLILGLASSPFWKDFTRNSPGLNQDPGPYALSCAVRSGQVVLKWKLGGDPSFTDPQAFRIFRGFSPGGAPILIQTVPIPEGLPAPKTMSTVDRPPYSTTWCYEIQAYRTKPDASGPYIRSTGVAF